MLQCQPEWILREHGCCVLIVCCFRVMLHNICQELTRENVADFLFLCQNKIARSKREEIRDPRDLFYVLEQLKIVRRDNLHFLSTLLTEIRRGDLAQIVEQHCQNVEGDSVAQHNSDNLLELVGRCAVSTSVSGMSHESPNQAVSYNPARLESDDADLLWQCRDARNDENVRICDELINRSMPASIDRDLARYAMDKTPRGNIIAF